MDKKNIIEQLEALQNKVDAMGFKGQNEYDLHLREEIADWILNLQTINKQKNSVKNTLCKGINDKTTTEIERLIYNILDKYNINPMLQPNLTISILTICDVYLQSQNN